MKQFYNFLIICISLFTWQSAHSQVLVNNPCGLPPASEFIVNAPCVNVTTAGLGPLFNSGTCNSAGFDDGWGWFQGNGQIATITYNTTSGDPILHIFEITALPCSVAELGCSDAFGTGGTETVVIPTVIGTSYFIRIQNWNSNATTTGCLDITTPPPAGGADYLQPTAFINNEKVGACLVTDCGPFTFADDGDGGNYSNNVPGIYSPANAIYRIFCPDAAGQCMRVTFNSFNIENGWDYLWVRNGPTEYSPNFTSAPTIDPGWGPLYQNALTGNLATPFNFQSTDASGCLGFAFLSDGSGVAAGWNATLECIPCAGGPNGTDNNDCQNLTPLCSGASIPGNSTGPGIVAEGCNGTDCPSGGENHTNWYEIQIAPGGTGTLDITMTPAAGTDDYDFAIYGPNATCAALGSPIRCTDSGVQGTTGLTSTAGDNTEDVSGDSFLQEMNVIAGETYIIVVDEWSSGAGGGYNLSFGGSANLDCAILLPVELIEFESEYVPNEDVVDVYWKTASELNNEYFDVERSVDGVVFEKIATVDGVGTTHMETSYYTTDPDPVVGVNYYRLKQVDVEGGFEYSNVTSVNILADYYDVLSISPNPTKGTTKIVFNCYDKGESLFKLYDSSGNLLKEKVIDCLPGANHIEIDLSTQSSGIYMVTLNTNHKSYSEKIIKN
ncbi:MAG: hypothetical protein ACI865_002836 [Flavobacteriaceae bacterium]|jgi:hypothetical protein